MRKYLIFEDPADPSRCRIAVRLSFEEVADDGILRLWDRSDVDLEIAARVLRDYIDRDLRVSLLVARGRDVVSESVERLLEVGYLVRGPDPVRPAAPSDEFRQYNYLLGVGRACYMIALYSTTEPGRPLEAIGIEMETSAFVDALAFHGGAADLLEEAVELFAVAELWPKQHELPHWGDDDLPPAAPAAGELLPDAAPIGPNGPKRPKAKSRGTTRRSGGSHSSGSRRSGGGGGRSHSFSSSGGRRKGGSRGSAAKRRRNAVRKATRAGHRSREQREQHRSEAAERKRAPRQHGESAAPRHDQKSHGGGKEEYWQKGEHAQPAPPRHGHAQPKREHQQPSAGEHEGQSRGRDGYSQVQHGWKGSGEPPRPPPSAAAETTRTPAKPLPKPPAAKDGPWPGQQQSVPKPSAKGFSWETGKMSLHVGPNAEHAPGREGGVSLRTHQFSFGYGGTKKQGEASPAGGKKEGEGKDGKSSRDGGKTRKKKSGSKKEKRTGGRDDGSGGGGGGDGSGGGGGGGGSSWSPSNPFSGLGGGGGGSSSQNQPSGGGGGGNQGSGGGSGSGGGNGSPGGYDQPQPGGGYAGQQQPVFDPSQGFGQRPDRSDSPPPPPSQQQQQIVYVQPPADIPTLEPLQPRDETPALPPRRRREDDDDETPVPPREPAAPPQARPRPPPQAIAGPEEPAAVHIQNANTVNLTVVSGPTSELPKAAPAQAPLEQQGEEDARSEATWRRLVPVAELIHAELTTDAAVWDPDRHERHIRRIARDAHSLTDDEEEALEIAALETSAWLASEIARERASLPRTESTGAKASKAHKHAPHHRSGRGIFFGPTTAGPPPPPAQSVSVAGAEDSAPEPEARLNFGEGPVGRGEAVPGPLVSFEPQEDPFAPPRIAFSQPPVPR